MLGAAGVGYAATTKTIAAKPGDTVSAPGHITCLVAKTNVSCAPRTGYFAVVGAKGVIVFTRRAFPTSLTQLTRVTKPIPLGCAGLVAPGRNRTRLLIMVFHSPRYAPG